MITIDPLDDEVVNKNKLGRSKSEKEHRSPNERSRMGQKSEKKKHSRLGTLVRWLLHGAPVEED